MRILSLAALVLSTLLNAGPIEIVQSVPLETSLTVSGIRDAKTVWMEMIEEAKQSIDLEHFYVTEGEPLNEIIEALRQASKKVSVRMIVDKKFYDKYPEGPDSLAATPTIAVRTLDMSPGIQHAKFFIIDGTQSFIGSQNFDWRALIHIHEVGAILKDTRASQTVQRVFEYDWARAQSIRKENAVPAPKISAVGSDLSSLRIVASPEQKMPSGIGDSLAAILNLLKSAKKQAVLEIMDYSPKLDDGAWTKLDDAIRSAAARGVKMRILIDEDHYLKSKAALDALSSLANITVKSVKIPEFSGGAIPYARLIHAKYLVVDRARAWLGTENWAGGYFVNCRNIGLTTNDATAVSSLQKIFEKVWTSPYTRKCQKQ